MPKADRDRIIRFPTSSPSCAASPTHWRAGNASKSRSQGECISVPVRARYNIEHEREDGEEEIEFQIKWVRE